MRRAVMLTVIVVASIVAACGDGGEAETTPTPAAQPTATAEASLTATPSPEPTGTPTPRPLALEDAAQYFDITAVLPPDFRQVDPAAEGVSFATGPGHAPGSEIVMYVSDEPFQSVVMYMTLASGDTEKAAARREFKDREEIEERIIVPLLEQWELATFNWQDVDVGDMAMMACCFLADFFPDESRMVDILSFIQEEGQHAAIVQVWNTWRAGETPVVDTITIAEEISNNIANR